MQLNLKSFQSSQCPLSLKKRASSARWLPCKAVYIKAEGLKVVEVTAVVPGVKGCCKFAQQLLWWQLLSPVDHTRISPWYSRNERKAKYSPSHSGRSERGPQDTTAAALRCQIDQQSSPWQNRDTLETQWQTINKRKMERMLEMNCLLHPCNGSYQVCTSYTATIPRLGALLYSSWHSFGPVWKGKDPVHVQTVHWTTRPYTQGEGGKDWFWKRGPICLIKLGISTLEFLDIRNWHRIHLCDAADVNDYFSLALWTYTSLFSDLAAHIRRLATNGNLWWTCCCKELTTIHFHPFPFSVWGFFQRSSGSDVPIIKKHKWVICPILTTCVSVRTLQHQVEAV